MKIPLPEHLEPSMRSIFEMIVEEMERAGVDVRPVDSMMIEGLASHVETIRRARTRAKEGGEVAAIAEEIEAGTWRLALSFAEVLQLSEEALRRIALVQ